MALSLLDRSAAGCSKGQTMRTGHKDWQRLEVARTALEGITDALDTAQEEEKVEIHDLRTMLKLLGKAEVQLHILAGDDVDVDGD